MYIFCETGLVLNQGKGEYNDQMFVNVSANPEAPRNDAEGFAVLATDLVSLEELLEEDHPGLYAKMTMRMAVSQGTKMFPIAEVIEAFNKGDLGAYQYFKSTWQKPIWKTTIGPIKLMKAKNVIIQKKLKQGGKKSAQKSVAAGNAKPKKVFSRMTLNS